MFLIKIGGAEATLAVADLVMSGYSINYFMTFGINFF